MKLKTFFSLTLFSALVSGNLYANGQSKDLVISIMRNNLAKYEVTEITGCRFKFSSKIGPTITDRFYFFKNITSIKLLKSAELGPHASNIAKYQPFVVALRSDNVSPIFMADTIHDPNPFNLKPNLGFSGHEDDIFFKNENDALNFKVAVTSLVNHCQAN